MELLLTYLILTAVGLSSWYSAQRIKRDGQCVISGKRETLFSKPDDVVFTGEAANTIIKGYTLGGIIVFIILATNLLTNWPEPVALFFTTVISVLICSLIFLTRAIRIYETE